MTKKRIEVHLTPKVADALEKQAKATKRTRKAHCEDVLEKQSKKPIK